jgi:hypothetical protein
LTSGQPLFYGRKSFGTPAFKQVSRQHDQFRQEQVGAPSVVLEKHGVI